MIRIIILLLALFSFSALSQEQDNSASRPTAENPAGQNQSQTNQQEQPTQETIPGPINQVQSAEVTNIDERSAGDHEQSSEENRYIEANSIAGVNGERQAGVAHPVNAGFNYPLATLIINIFGMLILGGSLYLANKNAKAAYIAIQQNRAWITYDELAENNAISDSGRHGLRFHWKNTGQSPALKVRLRFGDATEAKINQEDRSTYKAGELAFSDWHAYGAIGPGQSFPMAVVFTDQQVYDIRNEDTSYILYFEILYELSHDRKATGRTEATYEISFYKDRNRAAFDFRPIGVNNECT